MLDFNPVSLFYLVTVTLTIYIITTAYVLIFVFDLEILSAYYSKKKYIPYKLIPIPLVLMITFKESPVSGVINIVLVISISGYFIYQVTSMLKYIHKNKDMLQMKKKFKKRYGQFEKQTSMMTGIILNLVDANIEHPNDFTNNVNDSFIRVRGLFNEYVKEFLTEGNRQLIIEDYDYDIFEMQTRLSNMTYNNVGEMIDVAEKIDDIFNEIYKSFSGENNPRGKSRKSDK